MMLGRKRNDGWRMKAIGLAMVVLTVSLLVGLMEAQQGGRIERERIGQREDRGRFPELMGRFGQRFPSDAPFFPPNSRQRLSGLGFRSRQHSQNVELVGFTGGAIYNVFVKGNYAYCASGSGLLIFDVFNPSNPKLVGKLLLPDVASGVYVLGNYAYVAVDVAGLRVIDVSDPTNPREVGYFDTPDWAKGVYVLGNYAYVANWGGGLIILRFIGAQPVNHPPSVPVLLSPTNNATVSPTPTFKLKSEDPDGDNVKFEIEVVKGSETRRFETGFFSSGSEATFTVPENQSLSEGQWSWRARAIDSKGAASEWSSAWTFTVQVQLAKSDLIPKDLTLSASEVTAGGKVTVRFKVVNQGQAKANPSKTNVRLSPSPDRPTKDDPLLVSFDTPALEPNQSVTHEAEVTIPAETEAGDYYVWVIVDVNSTAGQSDESNDRIKAPLKVKAANRPPVLTKVESPPDKGVATGQPWFRIQAEDPDGDRVTYRIELKRYSSPPQLPSTFPTPDYVFDQKSAESKGWWMPGDEWRQTENRRVQSGAYTSGSIAQFQPKEKLPKGYYLWRVIVTDEKGAVYEMPRQEWRTFRVIHHNPIVLVHGFNFGGILRQIFLGQPAGAELPLNNPANWNEAVKVIKSFGYIPLYEAYREDTQTPDGSENDYADLFVVDNLNTSLRVDTNGNLMWEYMFGKVRPRISYEVVVDLIGHSMGGLIARAYVGLLKGKVGRGWAVSLAFNGEVGVERIVTLGTPHSGASLADVWWAKLLRKYFKDLPAVQDLSLEGACRLNNVYPVVEGIQYLLFAAEIDVTALLANIYHPGPVTLKSDGIVDVESAHWKWYCKREQRRRPNSENVIEIPPLDMGFDFLAHFNLISVQTTKRWMEEYLRQLGKGGFKSYRDIITTRQESQQLEEIQSTELWLGFVQQGQEISREVFLDKTSDAVFVTNWLVGQISFTLQSPTGQQITPEQAREGGDIQFFEIPNILGTFKVFLIKNASQGRWVMKVRGESEIPPDGTPALMWAVFYSPLKLNVEIPKAIYSVGEGAVLKAQLTKAGQPVTGAIVIAEVVQPGGQLVTVNLLDDGEHQDGIAGDGVYGAVLTNLIEPGTYRFIVTAKGQTRQEGGINFERSAIGAFEVASPAARLTGQYSDEGVDEDNDGLFEWLRVDVQVQVQQAGNFTLSGALADGSGRIITQASVSFEATSSGVVTVSLPFDGESIGNWGYSGRFQLRDITLLHQTDRGWIIADIQEHPYDTREYQANQFPSTLSRQSHYLAAGLHFISIPMDLANSTWSFLLGQITSDLKVATWVGDRYAFYPQEPANEAQLGKAYWVKLTNATDVTALGRKIAEDQPYFIPLRQGWNAIGIPFISSISWNLQILKVRLGSEEKTLEQAQQARWIEDYAWGWEQDKNDPNTGRYVLIYDTSIILGVKGQLEPWKGYWVYAHTDCELVLPPPSQSKGRGTRDRGRVVKGNGWSIRLQASVNGSVGEAVMGIANGTRGLAVGLPPDPPTGSSGVQVILLKNNVPLAVDVRSDISRRQEWDVLVRFGTRDE